jgi:hypothetical protein
MLASKSSDISNTLTRRKGLSVPQEHFDIEEVLKKVELGQFMVEIPYLEQHKCFVYEQTALCHICY